LNHKGIHGIVYLPTLLNVRVGKPGGRGIIAYVDLLRDEISESLSRNLSEIAASLSAGFLIGETREIPPDVYRWFRDSGTLHLLAVSGSNVALVIFFLIIVLRPLALPRKRRAMVLMGCVMLFALLSYGEPSVVRASLMAVLILLANIFERRYNLNQIIASAAMIILLAAPTQLFSVGFQLSFVTAWGLIFVTPRVAKLFEAVNHKGWYRWLVLPFMISLIAQLFSMPLIALYFGKVPAISVIANLVIIPPVLTIMLCSSPNRLRKYNTNCIKESRSEPKNAPKTGSIKSSKRSISTPTTAIETSGIITRLAITEIAGTFPK